MLDIHTHLIPALDDGSRSVQESSELIKELEMLGFDSVAFTPHFYPNDETVDTFLRRRDAAYEDFTSHVGNKKTYRGCECYLHDYLFYADDISPLCLEGTRLLLTELSYDKEDGETMLSLVHRLVSTYNVTPVLAHVERYPYIMKKESFFKKFIDLGCRAQANLAAFSDFFIKNKLADYVEKGYITYLGTDIHRLPFEKKVYGKAVSFLEKRLGGGWKELFAGTI